MFSGAPIDIKYPWGRLACFFVLWLIIAGWSVQELPLAAAAGAGALWVSLKTLPRGRLRVSAGRILVLVGRLLYGSFAAGLDVARRALARRPDLRPGFVSCPLTAPEGEARNLFCLLQSLMPGTLPTGAEDGTAFVHALDISQPIAEEFSAQERLYTRAIGDG
ncbi:multicomponent Na+:H+ antiporter subunit E [Rhodoblastus acidophilus]|nr:Na+/H+ antiporter subunit E [Rhodoblastus acidophilus]MCW2272471.1 multicomponent Na+:H+ antiporter subunit E [Rhodoblastus acidophilus]